MCLQLSGHWRTWRFADIQNTALIFENSRLCGHFELPFRPHLTKTGKNGGGVERQLKSSEE